MPRQPDKQSVVFGYVRVSTENQIENYSIDEQIHRIKSYCSAKGWTLLKVYTDGGYSGGNTNRPALQQMIKALRTNKVDAVVVYKLDRLSRSQKDTLTLIEDEFLSHDVDFVSISENFDTSTPFGRAMIGILSVFAQLEKDQITERLTMGRVARGKAGYFHGGGAPPFGYSYTDGELLVDEYQATQVRAVFNSFLAGKSINAIWHEIFAKYGGQWNATKTRLILMNSVYIGKVKFAGVEYDGRHAPIISNEVFKSTQEFMFSDERESGKTTPQKTPFRANTLLSGIVYCTRCGAKYSGGHGYYKCYSRSKSNQRLIVDPTCKNDNWAIEELNENVIAHIRSLLTNKKTFASAVSSMDDNDVKVDVKAIEKTVKDIDVQMEKLIDLYQIGSIPMEVLTSRIDALNTKKIVLQKQLDTDKKSAPQRIAQFENNVKMFSEEFDDAPIETRRLLISSLVERVQIDGQSLNIKWRI